MRKLLVVSGLALLWGCSSEPARTESVAGGAGSAGTSGSTSGSGGKGEGGTTEAGGSAGRAQAGEESGGDAGQSGGGASGSSSGSAGMRTEPVSSGTEVDLSSPNATAQAELEAELDELDELDTEGLLERYPTDFAETLGYTPSEAIGLDLIQGSALSLDEDELAVLDERGFVITDRHSFPTFTDGYVALYGEHLPLYVSADSILNATHRSYDKILQMIEEASLVPRLDRLLTKLRSALHGGDADAFGATAVADADTYLTVAASLLAGEELSPESGGSAERVGELYAAALEAEGLARIVLFGVEREVDFSQYAPRGHYVGTPELERYFRSMMWLGAMDLRLIETQEDGSSVFRRRQLELAYALRALFDSAALDDFGAIDGTVRAFVGESDNMTLAELDQLLADLDLGSASGLAELDDRTIAQAIVDGRYGTQQISGHILINGTRGEIPLSSTFLLFGQRYVVDSHVFSNVVYGRVPERNGRMRMMPNPLDVAFGALQNDQAASLLESELDEYGYAPELASVRTLVDTYPDDYWRSNLYTLWLGSLRTLSPPSDLRDPVSLGLPRVAGTEAWGRRILNTQLASWAELRHDTVLYAKPSYTDVPGCEFPDGYVDPYPEFYAALGAYAERGLEVAEYLDDAPQPFGAQVSSYFRHLAETAATLKSLAEHERTGMPFDEEQIAFLNRAVAESEGCFTNPDGWYPNLVFMGGLSETDTEFDPPIVDVHTQPADEGGNPVGRVLHVSTGLARLFVVTTDSCTGSRAYAGLASSYFEQTTEDFERLKDQEWAEQVMSEAPAEVPWMADLVGR